MTAPARTAAYRALVAIATHRVDLPAALAHSRETLRDDRDRALAADIIAGTLRWQRALDHLIVHVSGRPLDRIDDAVVIVLRMSLYQIGHLDRVPAAAVVDDAVDLARAARKRSATGFVNAVLRTALRQRGAWPLPPKPDDPADRAAALRYLGITHSHPEWLVERWLDRHGLDATERWVRFNNVTPPLTLRANRLRITRDALAEALRDEDIETAPTTQAPDGLVVLSGRPLARGADPRFLVQDEASQLVPLVVAAQPGERVLDLCASPGGKTTAMAAAMQDSGLLVACDVRAPRVSLLRDTVAVSGATHVRLAHLDGDGELPFTASFDRVLVDAPCSGLGTLRRDPDIRWRRTAADLPALVAAQRRLLARAARVVVPGGRLVYATCSSEPDENDAVVDAFLHDHPDYTRLDLRVDGDAAVRGLVDDRGQLHTLPFAHGLEAFFAAALVRRR